MLPSTVVAANILVAQTSIFKLYYHSNFKDNYIKGNYFLIVAILITNQIKHLMKLFRRIWKPK